MKKTKLIIIFVLLVLGTSCNAQDAIKWWATGRSEKIAGSEEYTEVEELNSMLIVLADGEFILYGEPRLSFTIIKSYGKNVTDSGYTYYTYNTIGKKGHEIIVTVTLLKNDRACLGLYVNDMVMLYFMTLIKSNN